MYKYLFSAVAAVSLLVGPLPVSAQNGVYTPKPGSPERKAIMDALRVPVQKDLKMPIIFVVAPAEPDGYFRVKQGWAFVYAEFRHSDGAPMGPVYYAPADGNISADAAALLHRVHGRWHVLVHIVGGTDIPWVHWGRDYHAPSGLLPNQETSY